MSSQQLNHTRRAPLGDLLVSPTTADDNQRDLVFPPWLDAIPTPPHNSSHHGNQAVQLTPFHLGVMSPPARTRVPIYEDVRITRPNGTRTQRQPHNEHVPLNTDYKPDTPPKTPETNNNTAKRKRDSRDDGTPIRCGSEGTFKKPKSMKSLQETSSICLRSHLMSLSSTQLVDIVSDLVNSNPELRKDLESRLPEPDLSSQYKTLSQLMHNVYRALPRTRLGSTRGALCYRRVRIHLSSFKKYCLQQARHLVRCASWKATINYSLNAWDYTASLPVWDNPAHNIIRGNCFQGLAAVCIKALKHGQFDEKTLIGFRKRMQTARIVDNVMDFCISRIDSSLEGL